MSDQRPDIERDDMEHHDDEGGPLLAERLSWEADNPRPESIVHAERAIVRALRDAGFGSQHQVTARDRFEIAVDDLLIRVEVDPDAGSDLGERPVAPAGRAPNQRRQP